MVRLTASMSAFFVLARLRALPLRLAIRNRRVVALAVGGVARVHRAGVVVVAEFLHDANASLVRIAPVSRGALVAVVARRVVGERGVDAFACARIAGVCSAGVAVVAVDGGSRHALALLAFFARGALVAVVARRSV